jgi:hypothetical protein
MAIFAGCNRNLKTIAVRLMAAAVITQFLASCPGPGSTYSCGELGSAIGHCYGIVRLNVMDFGSGPMFRSFFTNVNAVPLNGGNSEISDEFWVIQPSATNCGNQPSACWIEVGLSAGGTPNNETHVFWADNRPNQGVFYHDMGALQPQEFNQPVMLWIAIRPRDPNSYDVDAGTCETVTGPVGCQGRRLIGRSTNNTMMADVIEMGLELAGTSGASAQATNFFRTIVPYPNSPVYFKYLDVDGRVQVNAPVTAGWVITPTSNPPSRNIGGLFFTSCCQ